MQMTGRLNEHYILLMLDNKASCGFARENWAEMGKTEGALPLSEDFKLAR
jgi:hypothetical protein